MLLRDINNDIYHAIIKLLKIKKHTMHLRYVNTWKIDVCNWAYKCISKLKLFQRIYAMSLFVKQVIKRGLHLHKIELIID